MSTSLRSLLLYFFILCGCEIGAFQHCARIQPDSPGRIPVELGKEFTATCNLMPDTPYTADDIEWSFLNVTIPRTSYKKINNSAVSVTVNISDTTASPLKCIASTKDVSFKSPCQYGIYLVKGYPPLKPKNVTCVAVQAGKDISNNLTCSWDPGTRKPLLPTNYTLHVETVASPDLDRYNPIGPHKSTGFMPLTDRLTVDLGTFPNHMYLAVWVEVKNALGTVSSEKLVKPAEVFAKPKPPLNVRIIAEDIFPTSLMVNWTHPFHSSVFSLMYNIRYCQAGSSVWTEVPQEATARYTESFRLQTLQPYTYYVVQMRCINQNKIGYWSEWSSNVTTRTPEAIPGSAPDLWRVYEDNDRVVKLIWKDPVKSNGKILAYNITVEVKGTSPEKIFVQSNEHLLRLTGEETYIKITANNSVGVSPETTLMISRPDRTGVRDGEQGLNCSARDGQLWVEWSPPTVESTHTLISNVKEYLLEWVSIPDKKRDWQRVPGNTNIAVIKGLEPFKRYNISVYPMYPVYRKPGTQFPGKGVTVAAYLQQGSPLQGISINVTKSQKNSALLTWDDVPIESQRGFLTKYTIFYKTGNTERFVEVGPNVFSHKLEGLESHSRYEIHGMASNSEGSVNGSSFQFYTKAYDDGEIEVIVVLVCLGFLFFIVFIMMLSLKNRDVIKKHLWPQVPDPSHSTIATWSPDSPTKADTPKEATLPEVSVVEVDVFDGKSLCEEDKTMLPLKKDKYFSEEHSSGIGGSSCMSSPRQSVSDSDEGDSGQTTASTVQYSSVVASGYKGQTPSLQAPVFTRSESTQPLLDCEEHPEGLLDNSSHQRNSYFRRGRGLEQLQPQDMEEASCFSSMEEEDTPTLTEDPPGPAPAYMPQQSGYRPQ